jgi:hypothetical protein
VIAGVPVTAAGGTLTLSGGDVEITVPAGAVSGNTVITSTPVAEPQTSVPSGWRTVGQQYALGPAGLSFAQPVTVKFKLRPGDLPAYAMSGDLAVRQAANGQWSTLANVSVDATNRTISARTSSFGASASALAPELSPLHATSQRQSGVRAIAAPEPTTGVSARDAVVTISPSTASVNAQQRGVILLAAVPPAGAPVPLPATTPAPLYRWTTTGRNGALTGVTVGQWVNTTQAQYVATNAVLDQLTGPIDDVRVELLLNPGETDPAKQRLVSARAVIDADLDRTYNVLPAGSIVAPGESKSLQLLIRDRRGATVSLLPSQSLVWSTSGVFGTIGTPGPRQESVIYRANATFSAPPPRVDDVRVKVVEQRATVTRVFKPGVFGGEGAFDETTIERTIDVAEKREFVEVKVNYQIVITPSPSTIAATGTSVLTASITPAYTGPGLMYKWSSARQHGALNVVNNERVTSPSVTYTANGLGGGTESVRVDVVSVVAGVELETLGTATIGVVVDSARLAWRVSSFTLIAQSGLAPTDCVGPCDIFTRVQVNPASGFIFAFPTNVPTLTNPGVPTPGVYLYQDFAGGNSIRGYPASGAGMFPLAHRFNGVYLSNRPTTGTFTYTGNAVAGTISGSALPVGQNSFYDWRMSIEATKDGDQLVGEIEVLTFPAQSPANNWNTKRWRFRAVRMP